MQRALVTGAARGIGRAVAARLAAGGARVALVDIDSEAVARAAAEIGGAAYEADVSDEDSIRRAIETARADFGGLDTVVANAAVQITGRDARAHELDLKTWQRTLDVNLTGAFLTAKHAVRAFRRVPGDNANVVFVASPAGLYGIARDLHAYSASKAGLVGLVKVMAVDYAAAGIRVNGVFPGITDTPMNEHWTADPERVRDAEEAIPLGRIGTPEEVAAVTAWLASPEASYVTGAIWTADGGLTAQ